MGGKLIAGVYSEPFQTCKMQCFAKTVNGILAITIFTKCSILEV